MGVGFPVLHHERQPWCGSVDVRGGDIPAGVHCRKNMEKDMSQFGDYSICPACRKNFKPVDEPCILCPDQGREQQGEIHDDCSSYIAIGVLAAITIGLFLLSFVCHR